MPLPRDRTDSVGEFIRQTSRMAAGYSLDPKGTRSFIIAFCEHFAFIRLQDVWNPIRFLRQMEGKPPVRLGIEGFKASLLDDDDPARHYAAFIFIGYWVPNPLALLLLWAWEGAGALRYGHWSQSDTRSGYVGIYHGRLVRRHGHTILPALMARDLVERGAWSRLSEQAQKVVMANRQES